MSIGGDGSLQTSDSNQMGLEVGIVVVQVVSQSHDSVSQSVSDGVPVVDSVGPDGISGSVGSNADLEVVDGNSVSVESNLVSLVRNSEGSNHVLLVSDGVFDLANSALIDLGGFELDVQRVLQSVDDVSVLGDQSSEVVDSVDMDVDGSLVDDDLMSETHDLSSVSMHDASVGHNFLFLVFAIQLSGLGDRR